MATERFSVRPGPGFDPSNRQHVDAVLDKLRQADPKNGAGWQVQSYSPDTGMLTLQRQSAVTQVLGAGKRESYEVALAQGTKPTDGDKVAAQLESDPQHAGYFLTKFDPYLGTATLSRMALDARRAREAVATAMGVKPWDVQVKARAGGGFKLELPGSYIPSKHDDKLQEVAESVVGALGWYFESDPAKLRAEIIPSDPPTFPAVIPYPMDLLPTPTPGALPPIPFGMKLASRGDRENEVAYLDLEASPHLQGGGTSGAGKSVTINSIIAGALAGGAQLAIADVPAKAVDFEKWRPFVRDGGWGPESLEENAVMLQELYKEGGRRAETLKRYGAKKLAELPADVQREMPPVIIIVDEVTGLFAPANERPPKGLDRDHPLVLEAESKAMASGLIQSYIAKIAAEMRFVGFKLVLSTQVASTATGIGTALRTNLGNKLLLGARATDGNRKLIIADVTSAPEVPKNIQADARVSKGVGVAELEGQPSFVFKSFFASEDDFIAQLLARGVSPRPEGSLEATRPDPSIVRDAFPNLAEISYAKRESESRGYGKGPRKHEEWELDPETGKPLSGFAKANAARHQLGAAS